MPYTPPSRSPSSSSYSTPTHHLAQGGRPQLPRSNSSTAYLQKHRRSPSLPNFPSNHGRYAVDGGASGHEVTSHPSVRQSPPPITDRAMPVGAIVSPPDSSQNSSDDETSTQNSPNGFRELQEAVRRSLNVDDQSGSPQNEFQTRSGEGSRKPNLQLQLPTSYFSDDSTPTQTPPPPTPPRLSAAARKISHSRSATESSIFDMQPTPETSASLATSDDSDDDMSGVKPPLLRKKSGELVKPAIRPSSRRKHSSMPGTPTYSKAVHFNDNIEQVRHFLQVDKPIAVSAGASPVDPMEEETEFPFGFRASGWELNLRNFPRDDLERMSKLVRVDRLFMSPDQKSLVGVVTVANLAFQKQVVARFTLDYWKTTSEVTAEYNNDEKQQSRQDGYDQFNFSIKLSDQANLESRTLLICIRYLVNGQEYWDNNDSMNYQVDFSKKEKTKAPSETSSSTPDANQPGSGARPIPRSRHNSAASTRPRSMPSFDDDFSNGLEPGAVKLRATGTKKSMIADMPSQRQRAAANGSRPQFSSRYDFGASLTAALSRAQAQLGDRSGLGEIVPMPNPTASAPTDSPPPSSSIPPRTGVAAPSTSEADTPRPDALLANRQSLDSRAYQEFVSKFCFFGSNKPNGSNHTTGTDGANDDRSSDEGRHLPVGHNHFSVASNALLASQSFNQLDGSESSTPLSNADSSLHFGYPFGPDSHSDLVSSRSQTPTAIHG